MDKRVPDSLLAADEQLAQDQRQYNESDLEWSIIERMRCGLAKTLDAANLLATLTPEDDTPHMRQVLQKKYAEADACYKEAAALAKRAGIDFTKFRHEFTIDVETWMRIEEPGKKS
jgi:hypothetical protein